MAEKKVTTKVVTTEEVSSKKFPKKKKSPKKKYSYKKSASVVRVEKQLMDNFVSLQKVLTNLTFKFEDMTKRLSDFLDLFEESAKAFVKNSGGNSEVSSSPDWQKEIVDKIDSLFEQNKILARGLTLIHDEAVKASSVSRPNVIERSSGVSISNVPVPSPSIKEQEPLKKPFFDLDESGETLRLNKKQRVKENPDFDVQEPPFSFER